MTANLTLTSPLDSFLTASHATFLAEHPPGADEDVHMLSSLVDHIIERCSSPGEVVFDPFAGFGTTIARALALGRKGLGIELLPERVEYIDAHVPGAHIIEGDARELLKLVMSHETNPRIHLIVTSPPYMTSEDHEADPLMAYEQDNGDYGRYLRELGLIAAQCARAVAPGGYVVWNVANILHNGQITRLIDDCAAVLAEFLTPIGVTEIVWDQHPHDLVADALLVFQRSPAVKRKS